MVILSEVILLFCLKKLYNKIIIDHKTYGYSKIFILFIKYSYNIVFMWFTLNMFNLYYIR